jgi:enoyl-CoA hydratase
MISDDAIGYTVSDHVAEIRLNRPPVNSLDPPMLDGIIAALGRAAADNGVRAVLVTSGVPRRFCAGVDLGFVLDDASGATTRRLVERLYLDLADAQRALGKPSVAVVNGAVRGGGMTLAISCDVILAGASATFGYPEIDVGMLPACHFLHLPRIVGRHRAFELLFSGRTFDAEEAATLDLISRVVEDGRLDAESRALAAEFAKKPPAVLRIGREAFKRINESDDRRQLEDAIQALCDAAATAEAREAKRAFIESRKTKPTA